MMCAEPRPMGGGGGGGMLPQVGLHALRLIFAAFRAPKTLILLLSII